MGAAGVALPASLHHFVFVHVNPVLLLEVEARPAPLVLEYHFVVGLGVQDLEQLPAAQLQIPIVLWADELAQGQVVLGDGINEGAHILLAG